MYFADRKKRELYFLRLLLLHVPGATSFENLRIFQHITYAIFFEAAVARNLASKKHVQISFLMLFVTYSPSYAFSKIQ